MFEFSKALNRNFFDNVDELILNDCSVASFGRTIAASVYTPGPVSCAASDHPFHHSFACCSIVLKALGV